MSDLSRIYDAHAEALFAHLRLVLADDADVRDVLQEVFRKLAARADALAGVLDERAYLLRIAHHAALDLCRQRTRRQRAHDRLGTEAAATSEAGLPLFQTTADPDEAAFRERLAAALLGLPAEQRTVVQLKLWEGWTFEQIATVLGIPPNTAASRYRYGIDKLRTELRPLYDEIR